MHALLFAENGRLEKPDLYARATELGLNPGQFVKCLDGEATNRVREDIATGKKLLVSSTPTFFIGRLELDGRVRITGRIKGFQPLSEFQAAIDSALKTH
jgi:protein-disulfide isomerase